MWKEGVATLLPQHHFMTSSISKNFTMTFSRLYEKHQPAMTDGIGTKNRSRDLTNTKQHF